MKRLFILLIIIITLLSFVTACGDDECTVVFIVEDDVYRVVTVLSGESVFAPEAPCIPGYEFCGWYCGGEPWRGGDPVFPRDQRIGRDSHIMSGGHAHSAGGAADGPLDGDNA